MSVSSPELFRGCCDTPSPQLTVLTAACISGNFSRVEITTQFDTSSGICGVAACSIEETATEYSVLVTAIPCGGGGELTSLDLT